jgi:quinol monooxygenase YgiN
MIFVEKTYTRPSVDTPWHGSIINKEQMISIMTQYSQNGKLLYHNTMVGDSNLQFIHNSMWKDQAAYDEYMSNPILQEFWAARDLYNESVGITVSDTTLRQV